jgi:hypothetical protein
MVRGLRQTGASMRAFINGVKSEFARGGRLQYALLVTGCIGAFYAGGTSVLYFREYLQSRGLLTSIAVFVAAGLATVALSLLLQKFAFAADRAGVVTIVVTLANAVLIIGYPVIGSLVPTVEDVTIPVHIAWATLAIGLGAKFLTAVLAALLGVMFRKRGEAAP